MSKNELEKECDKHPINFRELNPKEFAQEFGNTNYFYQKECFKELSKEYKRQSKEDSERGRIKLSTSLENLSKIVIMAYNSMQEVCNTCKGYLKNPFKEDLP